MEKGVVRQVDVQNHRESDGCRRLDPETTKFETSGYASRPKSYGYGYG